MLASKKAEFLAVYGRRRIGKTYLIQQCLSQVGIYLECTGLKNGPLQMQLANFSDRFSAVFYPGVPIAVPKSWREAFILLTHEMKKIPPSKKIILFFDELPWFANRKSQFLQNIDYFWNTEWKLLPNCKLIVCGSAAAWMMNNLINAKGGLHNRLTKSLLLEPFNLAETEEFIKSLKINLPRKQILDLYITVGGVPYYLEQLDPSVSLSKNVNNLFFKKDGLLRGEFSRLFQSLFDASELNIRIVKEVAKHHYGISCSKLVRALGRTPGGRFKERLQELEACGFIAGFLPYGKKKRDRYYKVIDEYTLFYLKWVAGLEELPRGVDYWSKLSKSSAWFSWAGYAFENVCYKHIDEIIHALDLQKVSCFCSYFLQKASSQEKDGAQVDLLLDRDDDAVTLCEIKYSNDLFTLDKAYAKNLMNKMEVVEKHLQKSKQLFLAIITTQGVKKNLWTEELVSHTVLLKDLFRAPCH
ncbi:MAG: ATP-binding protein [Chlamydiae bacterium]|nr:ATP-binding protein [Chlamydiota bacterium]